jgi:hypothetical protein
VDRVGNLTETTLLPRTTPTPCGIGGSRHGSSRGGDIAHEFIGVGDTYDTGNLVLVLKEQLIAVSPREAVEGYPCFQENFFGTVDIADGNEALEVGVSNRDGAQNVEVAKTAMRLFNVGFEEVGQIAMVRVTISYLSLEFGKPDFAHVAAPRLAYIGEH